MNGKTADDKTLRQLNVGGRIGYALDLSGLSIPDAARRAGVKVPTLRQAIVRNSDWSSAIEHVLAVLPESINKDWVRTGNGRPESQTLKVVSSTHGAGGSTPAVMPTPITTPSGHASVGALAAAPLRSWEHPTELPTGDEVLVPKLGVLQDPSTTSGIKLMFLKDEVQSFRTGWIREDQLSPAALAWYEQHDESMNGVVFKGDSYVVDTSAKTIVDGRVYALLYAGAVRLRRVLQLPNGGLRLKPSNEAFDVLDVAPQDVATLQIIGRVVHKAGRGGL